MVSLNQSTHNNVKIVENRLSGYPLFLEVVAVVMIAIPTYGKNIQHCYDCQRLKQMNILVIISSLILFSCWMVEEYKSEIVLCEAENKMIDKNSEESTSTKKQLMVLIF